MNMPIIEKKCMVVCDISAAIIFRIKDGLII
jgi:hypothetical protein